MIYKNILSKEKYNEIYQFISSSDFFWYYQPNIAYNLDTREVDKLVCPSFGFTHLAWDAEHGKVSEALGYVSPIIDSFKELTNIKINNFLRIKINLQVPVVGNTPEKYNGAHIDHFVPHKTLIYYLDDSDGDTFIFNDIFDPNNKTTHPPLSNPTIKEQVTPKANSLYYLEDGFRYHSSSNPINTGTRYTININFN